MLTVVTTCNKEGLDLYGHRFLTSFAKFWPKGVRLIVFTEGWTEADFPLIRRAELIDLEHESTWLREFKYRHRDNRDAHGTGAKRGFRHNAVRFSHKVAAILAADELCRDDHLLWVDADTLTHTTVVPDDIKEWLPDPAWLAWLDRDPKVADYPECGFLMFNRRHPRHAEAMVELQRLYETDALFDISETHDSFVIAQMVKDLGLPVHSLSGEGYRFSHVFVHSLLGRWFDHCKGNRKKAGRTGRGEIRIRRWESHWRK